MITKSTLLFGASGSFEEVTIRKWKRLRTLSHKASGNLSNITQRFRDQQAAVKLLVAYWKQIAQVEYLGWQGYKKWPGAFAAWMSYHLKNVVVFDPDNGPIFYPWIAVISKGSMPTTEFEVSNRNVEDQELTITWPASPGYKQAGTDKLGLRLYVGSSNKTIVQTIDVPRSAGTVTVTYPEGTFDEGDVLSMTGFFYGVPGTATAGTSSDQSYFYDIPE